MSGGRKTQKKVKRHFLERLESVNGNCYKRRVWTGEWALMPMGKYTNTNTNTNTNTITSANPGKDCYKRRVWANSITNTKTNTNTNPERDCYKRRVRTGECALVPMGNYKSVHPPFIFACQQLGLLPPVANI